VEKTVTNSRRTAGGNVLGEEIEYEVTVRLTAIRL
jgi:hypothetical protein